MNLNFKVILFSKLKETLKFQGNLSEDNPNFKIIFFHRKNYVTKLI